MNNRIITEGRLNYIASHNTVIIVSSGAGEVKAFRIIFGSDGSIYVPFSYFESKSGILTEIDIPEIIEDINHYELPVSGVQVTYDVKFSHHTSGIVTFSKTGKKEILPRRFSFPLKHNIGHIFKLYVYGLSSFDYVGALKRRDYPVVFDYQNRYPRGVLLRAEWRRKKDIIDNSDQNKPIGPTSTAIRRSTGKQHKVVFIGQPHPQAVQDKLLMVTSEEIDFIKGVDQPTTIFIGGFDRHEGKINGEIPRIKGALAFIYPPTPPSRTA